jgi:tRNA1(Val) A37 N6-methylase TrmN6
VNVTEGHLLGGRLRYAQPEDGYRTGIEPVLLAAAIPARPGERVLEAGAGAGAGLMCLAARVPGIVGVGVEIDPAMAALARRNIAANGLAGLEVLTGDVTEVALAGFDHAFANPPWHAPRSSASPVARRRLAKQAGPGGIGAWLAALARAVRPGASLTVVIPAAGVPGARAVWSGLGVGALSVTWLRPKQGRPAKLALLTGRSGDREGGGEQDLILHEPDGRYTPPVLAALRDGAELPQRRAQFSVPNCVPPA